MSKARLWLTLGIVLLAVCIASGPATSAPAAPPSLCGAKGTAPAPSPVPPGTPKNVAAFMGQWGDGSQKWSNHAVCGALLVTSVKPDGSAEVYSYVGEYGSWGIAAGSYRNNAKIEGNKLSFEVRLGTKVTHYEYTLSASGSEIEGRESAYERTITLPRVAQ